MKTLGYYDGAYGPLDEMTIPMSDRVCWFGDGVYDAGPCRNYHVFAMDEHVDRFYRSASFLDIRIPMEKAEWKELLNELVHKMDDGNLFVYYQVTRGVGADKKRSHVYEAGVPGKLWVTLTPATVDDGIKPISLVTTEDTRFLHCNIKTLNLIPSVMASQKAKDAGCQEAVFYRPGEIVTECAHSNIHILKNGELWTHPADHLILGGIARLHLIHACEALHIPVHQECFSLKELFEADEVIVTSSSNLCRHANVIDQKPVGGKSPELLETIRAYLLDEFKQATEA